MGLRGLSIPILVLIYTPRPVFPDMGRARMIPNLAEDWNRRRASHRFYPAIAFTDEGVVWGAGTVLARIRADPSGVPSLDVERDHDRIIALVAVAARGRSA